METLDLRCRSYDLNSMMNDAWTLNRIRKLKIFMTQRNIHPKRVLFIGDANDVDKHLAEFVGVKYEHTGEIDLNFSFTLRPPIKMLLYDYIFCFDVLEHLMNPLLFLECLKLFKCSILLTYPRHPFVPFWGHCHFHEFSELAFKTLIAAAGLKVVDRSTFSTKKEWWKFFNGFRPVIRFIFLMLGYPKHEIYILK